MYGIFKILREKLFLVISLTKLSYEFQPRESIFVTPFIQFIFSSSTVKLLLHGCHRVKTK